MNIIEITYDGIELKYIYNILNVLNDFNYSYLKIHTLEKRI